MADPAAMANGTVDERARETAPCTLAELLACFFKLGALGFGGYASS